MILLTVADVFPEATDYTTAAVRMLDPTGL
jgi:hypothetical protein